MSSRKEKIYIAIILVLMGLFIYQEKTSRKFPYAELFYEKAMKCNNDCSFEEKQSFLESAIYHDPHWPEPYLQLGILYNTKGSAEEAIKYFDKAILTNPEHARTYFDIGKYYYFQKKLKLSYEYFARGIGHYGDLVQLYYYQGRINEELGAYDIAIRRYQKAIEQDGLYAKARSRLAVCFHRLGFDEDAQKAIRTIRQIHQGQLADKTQEAISNEDYTLLEY